MWNLFSPNFPANTGIDIDSFILQNIISLACVFCYAQNFALIKLYMELKVFACFSLLLILLVPEETGLEISTLGPQQLIITLRVTGSQ